MTITLPETESQIKSPNTQRLQLPLENLTKHDSGPNIQALSAHSPGSIVVRFSVCGIVGVEIIADQSDEEEKLRRRLTAARPVLQLLHRMFKVDQLTSQRSR